MNKFLKAILTLLSAIIMLNSTANAQVDTSTTQKLLQYIMQPLDKNQIPTGFLEEYGCPMLPMATFNGTLSDSNRMDMHLWRTLYFQLQTGWTRTTSNPLPVITTINNTIKNNSGDTVLIPLLIGNYNTVKSNAFSSNLLSYNSSTKKVYDVAGRPQSPYDLKNLFAACPLMKETVTGTATFVIKPNTIWNNTGKTINQLQIDFANGQGFQTITIGSPITVSYSDTGYKRWTIKTTLSDNSIIQCYSDYRVLKAASGTARFQTPQSTVPAWGFINPVIGVHSGATIWVNYSNLNRTNTLRKPLVVVEGYDVSTIAPSLQFNYWIGDFIQAISTEPGNTYDFNGQLDDIAGYDLVFVDFNDGADDIVRNAAIVREVINRVNANKVLDNRFGNIRQQNVVMGLSMGGLCARYALANMTKNFPGTPTETRLLITHDSPHRGANVPLGLQYMIRMMGGVQLFGYNVYDIYPDYDDAIGLLDAPATQQLLLYRATTANSFANNAFLDATYRPMVTFNSTDPQPTYRFVATANGNECANPLFSPGKTFINLGAGVSAGIYGRLLFFRVPILTYKLAAEVEAYALPAAGSTNKIARVYTINNLKLFGFINIFKQLYNNTAYAPGNHLAVDGVPGSNYPLLDAEALNQLTNLPVGAVSLYVSFPIGPFLGGYFGAYAYNQGVSYNFTFVPVGSALDVSPYTTNTFSQKYVNGVNQNYPSSSETFIAQETVQNNPSVSNNVHIRFTARNSRWLFNEMENLPNLQGCSQECSNPYYISGPTNFCSNGIYSVPGLPRGGSITWNISPFGAANLSATGNQVTVTPNWPAGNATLTATLNNVCGGSVQIQKQIIIGVPDHEIDVLEYQGILPVNEFYAQNSYSFGAWAKEPYPYYPYYIGTIYQFSGTASYIWTIIKYDSYGGSTTYNLGTYSYGVNPDFYFDQAGEYDIILDIINNSCAHHSRYFTRRITVQNLWGRYTVSPNPSSGNIKISPNSNSVSKTNNKPLEVQAIEIVDKMGMLKHRQTFGKGLTTVNISVSQLPNDIYTLRIFDGQKWHSNKIVVQH